MTSSFQVTINNKQLVIKIRVFIVYCLLFIDGRRLV